MAGAVVLLAATCATVLMLPAPFPGHVVSSNDLIRQFAPFADAGSAANYQMTDPAQVFRPDLFWARDEVRSGHLPTWSPLVFAGWPLLASQQAAPLYPISALSYVLPFAASIAWGIIALLVLATLGVFLFARSLGLGPAPAALAGIAYGLSAPMVVWSLHPHSHVHATLGWMLLGVQGSVRGRRWGIPVLAAAIACAVLGGHPQSVLIDGLFVVAWSVIAVIRAPRRVQAGGRLLAGAALGFMAGAVVLLPLAEMLGQTGVAERGGYPGPRLGALSTLAFPDLWGRPDWSWSTDPPGLLNYLERNPFVGIVPLIVAVVGLAVRRDWLRWCFVAGALVAVVLAFDVPGVSAWLVAQWPLRLASIARAMVLLSLCVAMLAGLGLQALLDDPGALRRRSVQAVTLVVVFAPAVWIIARYQPGGGLDGAEASCRGSDGRPTASRPPLRHSRVGC